MTLCITSSAHEAKERGRDQERRRILRQELRAVEYGGREMDVLTFMIEMHVPGVTRSRDLSRLSP